MATIQKAFLACTNYFRQSYSQKKSSLVLNFTFFQILSLMIEIFGFWLRNLPIFLSFKKHDAWESDFVLDYNCLEPKEKT